MSQGKWEKSVKGVVSMAVVILNTYVNSKLSIDFIANKPLQIIWFVGIF